MRLVPLTTVALGSRRYVGTSNDCQSNTFWRRNSGGKIAPMAKSMSSKNRWLPNKAFKPLAKLARTPSTPHRVAHGFAIVAQTVLRAGRRLTGRYV